MGIVNTILEYLTPYHLDYLEQPLEVLPCGLEIIRRLLRCGPVLRGCSRDYNL